ncbi:DUF397 domain-containing protein [Streptomyces sp. NPDC048410]|uniref:DUF397 domain-containing protein n=1 Tax=Streptomyces sp. NPDC048410 TaxID=3365545 RepID=UPI003715DF57
MNNTEPLAWFKSSYSGTQGGDCVEVAVDPNTVHIRDSKAPAAGPTLRLSPTAWANFLTTERYI